MRLSNYQLSRKFFASINLHSINDIVQHSVYLLAKEAKKLKRLVNERRFTNREIHKMQEINDQVEKRRKQAVDFNTNLEKRHFDVFNSASKTAKQIKEQQFPQLMNPPAFQLHRNTMNSSSLNYSTNINHHSSTSSMSSTNMAPTNMAPTNMAPTNMAPTSMAPTNMAQTNMNSTVNNFNTSNYTNINSSSSHQQQQTSMPPPTHVPTQTSLDSIQLGHPSSNLFIETVSNNTKEEPKNNNNSTHPTDSMRE